MSSIARGFGAPDRVPAGKHVASTSKAVRPSASAADDRGHDVHDVAVALDRHELDDLDRARFAHPPEVVAAEVDEHEVLGPLLRVGAAAPRRAARPPRERPRASAFRRSGAAGRARRDLEQGLGAGADDVEAVEAQQVHVGARVRPAQHPVDVQRSAPVSALEPLRDHDLERLARTDLLLGRLDGVHVVVARRGPRTAPRPRVVGRGQGAAPAARGRRHGGRAGRRIGVGVVDALVGAVVVHGVGDEDHAALVVVEHGQVGGEQHGQLGQREVVRGQLRQALRAGVRRRRPRKPTRPPVSGGRPGQRPACSSATVCAASPAAGRHPTARPTAGRPSPDGLAVALGERGAPIGPRRRSSATRPPCSADSKRKVPGRSSASLQ